MYKLLLLLVCISVSVKSWEYPSFDYFSNTDYPGFDDYKIDSPKIPPTTRRTPETSTRRRIEVSANPSTLTPCTVTIPTPVRVNTVSNNIPVMATVASRFGEDLNTVQQRQTRELYCLEVLGNLVASQWQEEIDKISVSDLGNISTAIRIPEFQNYYSNPESEWIQADGMAFEKLDTCTRNLVSKTAPRMDQDEIQCLNDMYSTYMSKERNIEQSTERFIRDTSKEQVPFRSFHSYFEMTEILFENKNIDAIDDEVRVVHEDMVELYIKTEEDKTKKIFIIEQECSWSDSRALRETGTEDARYEIFRQLVKRNVNVYLVAEFLRNWVPGSIIPEYKYKVWNKARREMESKIAEEIKKLRDEKRDAQYICIYAAQLATKFFSEQKAILFEKMSNTTVSSQLSTYKKYAYVLGLQDALKDINDGRISHVNVLATRFKEGHYCITNFARMIENHQRYTIATAFVNAALPYAKTYCLINEMSAKLVNPRYCKCQGTFCESFGLATMRAERFQLNRLPNNTYTVTTNPSYRVLPLDELTAMANQRIAGQKFNTWWYRHQKVPVKIE